MEESKRKSPAEQLREYRERNEGNGKPKPVERTPERIAIEPTGESGGRNTVYENNVTDDFKPPVYEPCVVYKGNDIASIRVTSSLMKTLFFKGEPRPICPRKVYHDMLLGDLRTPPTEIMKHGSYFEALCFQQDQLADYWYKDLMKDKKSVPVALERIQEQARMFDVVTKRYGIEMIPKGPDKNIWIKLEGNLEHDKFPEIEFKLEGSSDLVTPVTVKGFAYHRIVLDLKLTINRNSQFGEFCWGEPQFMDVSQVVFYSYLAQIPAAYLVFDYQKNDRGHKFIPVATMAMFPKGRQHDETDVYRVARQRQDDLKILVEDTIMKVIRWHNEGYEENPSHDNCDKCPLNPVNQIKQNNPDLICDKAGMIEHI